MEKCFCSYVRFCCGISYETRLKEVFDKFRKEFSLYYKFDECTGGQICDADIYIVSDAYEGIVESEQECIHSSHSKNKKYLLNGEIYTQNDASLFACKKTDDKKIYYYIKKTDTKILVDLVEKKVTISGSNLYNMLVYVFETLLSINIEHNEGIQLHGACCRWNEKGYLITGKSGSGKTTLLFNMLKRGGYFHSNDRVAVFKEDSGYVAYSIPIPVNMPINMMRSLDKWKNINLIKKAENNSKIRFLVKDFEMLFEGNMVIKTKIDDILVVNYTDDEPSYMYLEDVKISDHIEVLSPYDENHPKWLPLYDYPNTEMVEKELDIMKKSVGIIKLSGCNIFKALEEALSENTI